MQAGNTDVSFRTNSVTFNSPLTTTSTVIHTLAPVVAGQPVLTLPLSHGVLSDLAVSNPHGTNLNQRLLTLEALKGAAGSMFCIATAASPNLTGTSLTFSGIHLSLTFTVAGAVPSGGGALYTISITGMPTVPIAGAAGATIQPSNLTAASIDANRRPWVEWSAPSGSIAVLTVYSNASALQAGTYKYNIFLSS